MRHPRPGRIVSPPGSDRLPARVGWSPRRASELFFVKQVSRAWQWQETGVVLKECRVGTGLASPSAGHITLA